MSTVDIVVVGAGGFGREVVQYANDLCRHEGGCRVKGMLDDNPDALGDRAMAEPILGTTTDYAIQEADRFVVGVGDPRLRRVLVDRLRERGAGFFTLVHPRAYVAPSASVGEGSVICPFAFVGPFARLDSHVVVNIYASAEHDSDIGAYSVLCPYATVNGHVHVAEEVFLGTRATVVVGKSVGRRSKLSAGAVAFADVPPLSLAAGNPAECRVKYADD